MLKNKSDKRDETNKGMTIKKMRWQQAIYYDSAEKARNDKQEITINNHGK